MDPEKLYSSCPEKEPMKVSEEAVATRVAVIPFVTPEKAAQVFSSQRQMSLEEGWERVDRSLGRHADSN